MDASRALDFQLYVLLEALCVLFGGLGVVVVGVLHVDDSTLMNCAKYRRKTVEGLFSNNMKKKSAPNINLLEEEA